MFFENDILPPVSHIVAARCGNVWSLVKPKLAFVKMGALNLDIGDRIKALAEDKGMTVKDFSDHIGVSKKTIQNYISDISRPSGDFLIDLSAKIGASPTWLLTGHGPRYIGDKSQNWHPSKDAFPEFVSIQRFDVSASAGGGSLVEAEIGTGHYAFNRSWLQRRGLTPDNLSVIAVRGDSMEPELYDQDLILLDRSQTQPRDGDMYVVRYFDELFVKRVQKALGRRYELLSSNRYYKPLEVVPDEATDLKFIGKVVASMHEW